MKLSNFLLPAILSFCSVTTAAETPKSDGNGWHSICNSGEKTGQALCGSFVLGYLSGVGMQAGLYKMKPMYCFPEGAAYRQAIDVFSKYLRDHPEKRHFDGGALFAVSMIEAFPCK